MPRSSRFPKGPVPSQGAGQSSHLCQSLLAEVCLPGSGPRCLSPPAREMRRSLRPLCSCIAEHLLSLLIWKQPRWDLPALAFFVEVSLRASASCLSCLPALWPLGAAAAWHGARARRFCLGPALGGSSLLPACPLSLPCAFQVLECLDLSKHGHGALLVMSRHLPSESRDRLRLQLRGLVVLSKEPSLVRRGQWLKPRWQRGAGERSPLGLPGIQQLRQLLPALLPPNSAASAQASGP